MSGLELAALGALAAAYTDANLRLSVDLGMASQIIKVFIQAFLAERRGQCNFYHVFERTVKRKPDGIALVYPRPIPGKTSKDGDAAFALETYTYRQLHNIILKYAHLLHFEYNIGQGDSVAFDCVNKSEYVFVWMALWSIGAKPAFINYNLKDHSLVHCIKAANAKIVIVDDEVADNVRPIEDKLDGVPVVYMDKYFYQQVQNSPPYDAPASERNPDDKLFGTAMLIYTSGTTGLPKAAIMSWHKATLGAGTYAYANRIRSTDIIYSAMPLYHSTASILGFLNAMYMGAGYAIGHKFSTSTFWTQVKLTKATGIQYVGETCRYLYNAPPHKDERNHNLRFAIGNGLRPDVWAKFKERFNIRDIGEFYGATEFPTAVTNFQTGEFGIGSVSNYGKLINGVLSKTRYRILRVDPDDPNEIWRDPKTGFGREVDVGEPGEFVFRVKADRVHENFQGYTNDKEATKKKILYDVLSKGDAFIRSGDLLKRDSDGLIYFVDRMGDTFRWKSENVSTNEIEESMTGVPGISQVIVVGVKVPNHEGRAGFAVIQPNSLSDLPDLDQLAKHLIAKLPRYAVPIFLKFVPEIETTGNNKVQKSRYRNQKIPSDSEKEVIYWLKNDTYVPLTHDDWSLVTSGSSRL
ncbi:long-chain fatty acid transporter FAT1 [Sugiyamaella lignohabitans]|uniref:Very long-chain fatty acid transport protein n=1 Tax=Sugiyamaella lignohabitans TaxID=796027 RepID=A0A167FCF6_9ASCO|nr:long-chain fatty acid transporter FAT1 [Sugiyamaella lignohabitans]ANB15115.1 long-chain fatty acid transporter FAT1 [Sugiyamaella lignohabitans]